MYVINRQGSVKKSGLETKDRNQGHESEQEVRLFGDFEVLGYEQ